MKQPSKGSTSGRCLSSKMEELKIVDFYIPGTDVHPLLSPRESTSTAVCLIEWAERLQSQCPENHLAVHISIKLSPSPLNISQEVRDTSSLPAKNSGEEQEEEDIYTDQRSRRVTLTPHGTRWRTRLLTLVESLSMAKHGGLNVIKGYE